MEKTKIQEMVADLAHVLGYLLLSVEEATERPEWAIDALNLDFGGWQQKAASALYEATNSRYMEGYSWHGPDMKEVAGMVMGRTPPANDSPPERLIDELVIALFLMPVVAQRQPQIPEWQMDKAMNVALDCMARAVLSPLMAEITSKRHLQAVLRNRAKPHLQPEDRN